MIKLRTYYISVFVLCAFYGCYASEEEKNDVIPITYNGKTIDYAYKPDPCGGCDSCQCATGCCFVGSTCGIAQTIHWACMNQTKTVAEGCNPGCVNTWFTPCVCPTVGDAVKVGAEWTTTACTIGLLVSSFLTCLIPRCREQWCTKKRKKNERSLLLINCDNNNNDDSNSDYEE